LSGGDASSAGLRCAGQPDHPSSEGGETVAKKSKKSKKDSKAKKGKK
jgi:hypothetical protein